MPNLFPIVALYGAVLTMMMLILVNSLLTNRLGLPPGMGLIVLIIPFVALHYVASVATALLFEKICKFFGIYRLFNVTNKPIEKFFKSIAGIEGDG